MSSLPQLELLYQLHVIDIGAVSIVTVMAWLLTHDGLCVRAVREQCASHDGKRGNQARRLDRFNGLLHHLVLSQVMKRRHSDDKHRPLRLKGELLVGHFAVRSSYFCSPKGLHWRELNRIAHSFNAPLIRMTDSQRA